MVCSVERGVAVAPSTSVVCQGSVVQYGAV